MSNSQIEPRGEQLGDLILWDVIEEHFDEAEFLFARWERALHSPKYKLHDLASTTERRLEAHLDGLVVGGKEVAARTLFPELANEEQPIRATIAALALLTDRDDKVTGSVLDALLAAAGSLQKSLVRALVLSSVQHIDGSLLQRLWASQSDSDRAIFLGILSSRGVNPGDLPVRWFESGNPQLVNAALEALCRFPRRELKSTAEALLYSDNSDQANKAIRASLVLGSREAWQLCMELARTTNDPEVLLLTAILGEPRDHRVLYDRLESRVTLERMLWYMGVCGTVEAGDVCIPHLQSKDERVAKVAAEAMAWIGGFDLYRSSFEAPRDSAEEDKALLALEEESDANLELDGVDDLPRPNRVAIANWWSENRGRLEPNRRYMLGRPVSPDAIIHALKAGSLWRRHSVAEELSLNTAGEDHVSTNAFSSRQLRQISGLEPTSLSQWARP